MLLRSVYSSWLPMLTTAATLAFLNTAVFGQCESSELTAADGAFSDNFGHAVALDGNAIAIGARWDDDAGVSSGSVYIYRSSRDGWAEEQKIVASDAEALDLFGISVALSGDVLAVGALRGDAEKINDSGAVYVFRFDGTTWSEEAKLFLADAEEDDRFGSAVAVVGNLLIVGATLDDGTGSSYVYRFIDLEWMQEKKLVPDDIDDSQQFGTSVAISGKNVLIGSWRDSDNGPFSGSAYIFRFDGVNWLEETKLTASDASSTDFFGGDVFIAGNVALVGAYGDDLPGIAANAGSAYVFRFDGSRWNEEAKLVADDAGMNDQFGLAVAMIADTVLVGARYDDDGGNDAGAAYIFQRDARSGQWDQIVKVRPSNALAEDEFGRDVAMDQTLAVITRPQTFEGTGTTFVYSFDEVDCNQNSICDAREIELNLAFDCNHNAVPDECDLADGTLHDKDGSGVPDECEEMGDLDGDGLVGVSDLLILLASWGPCDDCNGCPADIDGNCSIGVADLLILLANWG